MRIRWAGLVAIALAQTALAEPFEQYPSDVNAFINRVGHCGRLTPQDKKLASQWECGKLASDRQHLVARYHSKPKLVEALEGQWVIKVQRINP
jgi:hypothetical protein